MTEVTKKMIEAGCRERCRQEGLRADCVIHYVASATHPYRYACDPIPQHMIGEIGRDGKLIVQCECMPLWRWRFYESVKSELEAALAAAEGGEGDDAMRAAAIEATAQAPLPRPHGEFRELRLLPATEE